MRSYHVDIFIGTSLLGERKTLYTTLSYDRPWRAEDAAWCTGQDGDTIPCTAHFHIEQHKPLGEGWKHLRVDAPHVIPRLRRDLGQYPITHETDAGDCALIDYAREQLARVRRPRN